MKENKNQTKNYFEQTFFPKPTPSRLAYPSSILFIQKMRRSKALPSKTVRRYRSISQRRMTGHDAVDEVEEIERLRQLLAQNPLNQGDNEEEDKKDSKRIDTSGDDNNDKDGNDDLMLLDPNEHDTCAYGTDSTPLIVPSSKKKKKTGKSSRVELTPAEIKQAKAERKKIERKLRQLQERHAKKLRRTELYAKLEQHQLDDADKQLLQSSATLGHTMTQRERLQHLLQKERAGISLSKEEHALLYQDRKFQDGESNIQINGKDKDDNEAQSLQPPSKKIKMEARISSVVSEAFDAVAGSTETPSAPAEVESASSFAAQMMASLQKLKQNTTQKDDGRSAKGNDDSLNELSTLSSKRNPKKKEPYVPTEPTVLRTPATLGIKPPNNNSKTSPSNKNKTQSIRRPPHVQESRQNLPVTAMEFEIMDAIQSNEVTILCGETGSGKSTQTPQFLYEHGLCGSDNEPLQIAITQPRRVAAVSTAKRVAYEMSCGLGHTIPTNQSNLVAYTTRYETAGLGPSTRLKFMTDGILLQEIQSDLLLRKYSVVVLDEAHERNLNTDVLIGLLSLALPLRRQAAQDPGSNIKPLKLVIMSATLRVKDFTENPRLFRDLAKPPAVVQVPGRTFPVTIHHAKITALDDYEDAAFSKICKIHRKLPAGGILVFLTGQQEILRMVQRLERKLNPKRGRRAQSKQSKDASDSRTQSTQFGGKDILRDLDDEEIDGDLFRSSNNEDDDVDDFDEAMEDDKDFVPSVEDDDSAIPQKAVVLPLYSLLSAEDQAKVFRPVPEGHRLIVVATNIAETVRMS